MSLPRRDSPTQLSGRAHLSRSVLASSQEENETRPIPTAPIATDKDHCTYFIFGLHVALMGRALGSLFTGHAARACAEPFKLCLVLQGASTKQGLPLWRRAIVLESGERSGTARQAPGRAN